MILNGFYAKCEACGMLMPGCATCSVLGTNSFQDRERKKMVLCGDCRRETRRFGGIITLHPQHRQMGKLRSNVR